MQNVITIGRRLIPVEQIALVEPFDPASNPEFKPEKPYKARIILLNRDSVLAEMTPSDFVTAHGFQMLDEDAIAVNLGIAFRVETFEPTDDFKPEKAFLTRLKWRDPEGNERSKLLLTAPEKVIALVLRRDARSRPARTGRPRRPVRSRAARKGAQGLAPFADQ